MKHPFHYFQQMSKDELQNTTGAGINYLSSSSLEPSTPPDTSLLIRKPPIATTMAIGEEGGQIPYFEFM